MESHKLNGPDDFFLKKCIIANLNIFSHKQTENLFIISFIELDFLRCPWP